MCVADTTRMYSPTKKSPNPQHIELFASTVDVGLFANFGILSTATKMFASTANVPIDTASSYLFLQDSYDEGKNRTMVRKLYAI